MKRLFLFLPFAALLAGCGAIVGTTINTANSISQSVDRSRTKSLIEAHLEWVKQLQARGDPMGDYLWAKANEDGVVANPIKDSGVLKQMYAEAAAKGSVDAQIVLGLKRFYQGASNRFSRGGTQAEWDANVPVWQDGLKQIEAATQNQCWYYTPYIFPPHNKRCLTPKNIAKEIWPRFRDGFNYPKDTELMNKWKAKREACEADPAYQAARRMCQPFGG